MCIKPFKKADVVPKNLSCAICGKRIDAGMSIALLDFDRAKDMQIRANATTYGNYYVVCWLRSCRNSVSRGEYLDADHLWDGERIKPSNTVFEINPSWHQLNQATKFGGFYLTKYFKKVEYLFTLNYNNYKNGNK